MIFKFIYLFIFLLMWERQIGNFEKATAPPRARIIRAPPPPATWRSHTIWVHSSHAEWATAESPESQLVTTKTKPSPPLDYILRKWRSSNPGSGGGRRSSSQRRKRRGRRRRKAGTRRHPRRTPSRLETPLGFRVRGEEGGATTRLSSSMETDTIWWVSCTRVCGVFFIWWDLGFWWSGFGVFFFPFFPVLEEELEDLKIFGKGRAMFRIFIYLFIYLVPEKN